MSAHQRDTAGRAAGGAGEPAEAEDDAVNRREIPQHRILRVSPRCPFLLLLLLLHGAAVGSSARHSTSLCALCCRKAAQLGLRGFLLLPLLTKPWRLSCFLHHQLCSIRYFPLSPGATFRSLSPAAHPFLYKVYALRFHSSFFRFVSVFSSAYVSVQDVHSYKAAPLPSSPAALRSSASLAAGRLGGWELRTLHLCFPGRKTQAVPHAVNAFHMFPRSQLN